MDDNWSAVFREFLPKMAAAGDANEYHLAVAEMLAHVHDTHAGIGSSVVRDLYPATTPVRLRWIEEKAVVAGFLDEDAAKEAGVDIGDVIVQIAGEKVETKMTRAERYISASSRWPPRGIVQCARLD